MKARILAALPYAAKDPSLLRYKRVTLSDGSVIKALDIASTAETVERSRQSMNSRISFLR
jgi:hypothetical protein